MRLQLSAAASSLIAYDPVACSVCITWTVSGQNALPRAPQVSTVFSRPRILHLTPNRCVARVCCKSARHWLTAAPKQLHADSGIGHDSCCVSDACRRDRLIVSSASSRHEAKRRRACSTSNFTNTSRHVTSLSAGLTSCGRSLWEI